MSSIRLDHVGLAVTDLEAATAWYCSALGFRRELDLQGDATGLDIVMLLGECRS